MNTYELTIELLSTKWPLKAKVIYQEVKQQKQVSYQAIHKTLKQMVKEKVLVKEKQEYKINLEYLTSTRKKWETIEQKYTNKQNILKIK